MSAYPLIFLSLCKELLLAEAPVVHRDHAASCALALLGMWERYAFAYNQVQELTDTTQCVLRICIDITQIM